MMSVLPELAQDFLDACKRQGVLAATASGARSASAVSGSAPHPARQRPAATASIDA